MDSPRLQDFTRNQLFEYDFPGTDAAVVFVPDGQAPSPIVQEILERSGEQRWFPVSGGHLAKIPWPFAEDHPELFQREPQGWDHEHCDFCNAAVNIGERCWTTEGESNLYVFCRTCYESLPEA